MFCFWSNQWISGYLLYLPSITYTYSLNISIVIEHLTLKTFKNCLSVSTTIITFPESLCPGPRIQPAKVCSSKIPNAKINASNCCSLSHPVTSSNSSCFKSYFASPSPNYEFNIPHRFAHREKG